MDHFFCCLAPAWWKCYANMALGRNLPLFTELRSRCQNRPVANEQVCELDRSTGLITSEERQRTSESTLD